jgi:hypothetical protein
LNSNIRVGLVFFSSSFEFLQFLEDQNQLKLDLNKSFGKGQSALCTLGQIWLGPATGRLALGLAAHCKK